MYKVIIEGASSNKGSWGPTGIGIVCIKLPENKELFRISKFVGSGTRNTAQYRALIYAMNQMLERSLTDGRIQFYSSSEILVKQVNGLMSCDTTHLRPLLDKAYEFKAKFLLPTRVVQVDSESTKAAYELAREPLKEETNIYISGKL